MLAILKPCPTCADNEPMFVPALTVFDEIDDEIEAEDFNLGYYGRQKPHPKLREKCEEYRKLLWWAAKRASKLFGGYASDYIGMMVLRMNYSLHYFKEGKGSKLSSIFCVGAIQAVRLYWLPGESENWAIYFSENKSMENVQVTNANFTFHESGFHLYRCPDRDDDWTAEIMESFQSVEGLWRSLTETLKPRQKWIVEAYYRDDRTLQSIGDELGISKERVRQVLEQSMELIRVKLRKVEDFARLFKTKDD